MKGIPPLALVALGRNDTLYLLKNLSSLATLPQNL